MGSWSFIVEFFTISSSTPPFITNPLFFIFTFYLFISCLNPQSSQLGFYSNQLFLDIMAVLTQPIHDAKYEPCFVVFSSSFLEYIKQSLMNVPSLLLRVVSFIQFHIQFLNHISPTCIQSILRQLITRNYTHQFFSFFFRHQNWSSEKFLSLPLLLLFYSLRIFNRNFNSTTR